MGGGEGSFQNCQNQYDIKCVQPLSTMWICQRLHYHLFEILVDLAEDNRGFAKNFLWIFQGISMDLSVKACKYVQRWTWIFKLLVRSMLVWVRALAPKGSSILVHSFTDAKPQPVISLNETKNHGISLKLQRLRDIKVFSELLAPSSKTFTNFLLSFVRLIWANIRKPIISSC